jgi:hypothetical protein
MPATEPRPSVIAPRPSGMRERARDAHKGLDQPGPEGQDRREAARDRHEGMFDRLAAARDRTAAARDRAFEATRRARARSRKTERDEPPPNPPASRS